MAAKPDFYRAKNTFYGGDTTCSGSDCDKKCVFPVCCQTRESFPTKTAADAHEKKLGLLKQKVEQL